jgi:hypothetical protein
MTLKYRRQEGYAFAACAASVVACNNALDIAV